MITPKNQSYNQVRNRIGFIFGLVSWQISNKNIEKEIPWLEGLNISEEGYNLSKEEQSMILNEINRRIKNGDLHYEKLK